MSTNIDKIKHELSLIELYEISFISRIKEERRSLISEVREWIK